MKVAVICDVLGEKNNGTTIAMTNLISFLLSRGHSVKVVCCDKDKKNEENYYICPEYNLGKLLNKVVAKNGVSIAKADKKILREVIESVDVVHVEVPFSLGQGARKIAKELNKPLTAGFHCQAENFTAHIFMMNCGLINDLTYHYFYNVLYKYCDKVHYPTEFIRELFERKTKITNGVIISNGVNEQFYLPHEFKKISEKFTILCIGRYSREKAQYLLIKAVAKSKYKDNIKIIFAGSGPYEKSLRRLADKFGVDAEFNFYSRTDLLDVLHGVDLYVHTAKIEIEAIACLEAIASGLVPVINESKRSATRFFALDDNNLFKENSVKSLTEKIEFWYDNPVLKESYVLKYREFAKNFEQEKCMLKMEEMLNLAIEEKKNGN